MRWWDGISMWLIPLCIPVSLCRWNVNCRTILLRCWLFLWSGWRCLYCISRRTFLCLLFTFVAFLVCMTSLLAVSTLLSSLGRSLLLLLFSHADSFAFFFLFCRRRHGLELLPHGIYFFSQTFVCLF